MNDFIFSSTEGPGVMLNKFVVLPNRGTLALYQVVGSPLTGWYLLRQVNDLPIKSSYLQRLEDFQQVNAQFFESEDDAKTAMKEMTVRTVAGVPKLTD